MMIIYVGWKIIWVPVCMHHGELSHTFWESFENVPIVRFPVSWYHAICHYKSIPKHTDFAPSEQIFLTYEQNTVQF